MLKYFTIPIGILIMIATFNLSNATDTNNFYDISFNTIDGNKIYLSDFRNKAFVITNTASFCGFTRQFDGFQSIWDKYRNDGLVVIGVPSNDFNQEAKTNAEVKTLCETNFSVDFILAETSNVSGKNAHPLFKYLADNLGLRSVPKWNFYKYIIDRNGVPVDYFSSIIKPDSRKFISAVEKELYS
jgi:glutathione peroxidase